MGSKTSKYGMGTISLRGDTWWIQYYRDGQRFRESSHSSERADAQNMLKRRLGEVATGQFGGLTPERVTVKQLLDLLYEDYYLLI